jgi:hypothetical protein
MAHLFEEKKKLGNLPQEAYKTLSKEVGKSFWAVAPYDVDPGSNPTVPSFSLPIDPRIRENTGIEGELRQWQEKAKEEGEARQRLEAKCEDMHLSLKTAQEEVSRLRSENSRLQQKISRSRLRANEAVQIWARISQYDENLEDENVANAIWMSWTSQEMLESDKDIMDEPVSVGKW